MSNQLKDNFIKDVNDYFDQNEEEMLFNWIRLFAEGFWRGFLKRLIEDAF